MIPQRNICNQQSNHSSRHSLIWEATDYKAFNIKIDLTIFRTCASWLSAFSICTQELDDSISPMMPIGTLSLFAAPAVSKKELFSEWFIDLRYECMIYKLW